MTVGGSGRLRPCSRNSHRAKMPAQERRSSSVFHELSRIITRRPKLIITLWVIAIVAAAILGPRLNAHYSAGGFTDPQGEAARADSIVSGSFTAQYPRSLVI